MTDHRYRAGRYVTQTAGYRAFIPKPLPPEPSLIETDEFRRLLSDADRALGRLDGVASVLPNPNLFVAMYVRHEAVLSSQIEGTQSTLRDILEYEAEGRITDQPRDVAETVNYVTAMNRGLERLATLPLSLRLIREIHGELLKGVRGQRHQPGEFRTTQNWIGPRNCTLNEAEFVPPPPHEIKQVLSDFEHFLQDRDSMPVLLHAGLAHAQFETIHPFLDGNGRIGRLLITLLLCERRVLQMPLLYLSYYFKAHRSRYYDHLTAIRNDGHWEEWLRFFLLGVYQVSQAATDTARAILDLREQHRKQLARSKYGQPLLDLLFQNPVVSVRDAERFLGCAYVTASNTITRLQKLGMLNEVTGKQRNRLFRYDPYIALFDRQAFPLQSEKDEREATTHVQATIARPANKRGH